MVVLPTPRLLSPSVGTAATSSTQDSRNSAENATHPDMLLRPAHTYDVETAVSWATSLKTAKKQEGATFATLNTT